MCLVKHVLAAVIALFSAPILADVPPGEKHEIDHLLEFVEQSVCKINRNGKIYDSSAVIPHIMNKYAYFKDEIQTSEQFIELAATKSTVTGKYYMVVCSDGKQRRTKDWLLQELGKYRGNGNT